MCLHYNSFVSHGPQLPVQFFFALYLQFALPAYILAIEAYLYKLYPLFPLLSTFLIKTDQQEALLSLATTQM